MSECRALTNFIGNGVATIVVAAWEGELDREALANGLKRRVDTYNVEEAVGVISTVQSSWRVSAATLDANHARSAVVGQPHGRHIARLLLGHQR
ncbi:hypothetical protein I9S53_08550 [Hyphomicrobium sulfonivorans]|nr:hypothetical protein [Hyphomicrobium sulfonivorans]